MLTFHDDEYFSILCWAAAAITLAAAAVPVFFKRATAGQEEHSPCTEDAMIVFDASGSMSGNGWGYGSETAGHGEPYRQGASNLAEILPNVTRSRRVAVITYGHGGRSERMERRSRVSADEDAASTYHDGGEWL